MRAQKATLLVLTILLLSLLIHWFRGLDYLVLFLQNMQRTQVDFRVGGIHIKRPKDWLLYIEKDNEKTIDKLYGWFPLPSNESPNNHLSNSRYYVAFRGVGEPNSITYWVALDADTVGSLDQSIEILYQQDRNRIRNESVLGIDTVIILPNDKDDKYFVYFRSHGVLSLTGELGYLSLFDPL